MSQRHAAAELPGLLQQARAVLDNIIKRLDPEDRRAVFLTCQQLAIQVLQSVPSFRLGLWTPPFGAPRQHQVTQLLDVEDSLGRGLANIRHLLWSGPSMLTDEELDQFCDALEQGQLQQLNCLGMVCTLVADGSEALQARLALALGHRLTHLETNNTDLLHKLQRFPQLRYIDIELPRDDLPSSLAVLTALPNLSVYSFRRHGVLGWSRKPGHPTICGKRCIVNTDITQAELASIPFDSFQVLEFQGGLPSFGSAQLLKDVWMQHGSKIVCTPGSDHAFVLDTKDTGLLEYFKALQGVHTANVMANTPLSLVRQLWVDLPACVRCVNFVTRELSSAQSVLLGLSRTITTLGLYSCTISARVLSELISGVPHVLTVKIVNPFSGPEQRLYPDDLHDSTWVTLANVEWDA